jgi:uncharacterized protein YjbI with pentapeptide repeats
VKMWLQSVRTASEAHRVQRWLLYAVAAGVLAIAVMVRLFPQRAGKMAVAVGRAFTESWLSVLLVIVAALIAAAAWGRGSTAQRPGRGPQLPLLVHVALLLGLASVVALGVGTLLWTAVGRPALTGSPSVPTPTSGAASAPPTVIAPAAGAASGGWTLTNTFDAMKIVLAVVGGIGGVVALTVAYRRQHLGEAAEHREESKERRENTKLFNERFAKAVELVGSDKAAVRLAGVYAVAALADDWLGGRQMCIDVLCAYLRMPYTPPASNADDSDVRFTLPPPEGVLAETTATTPAIIAKTERDPHEERQVRHTVIRLIRDHLRLSVEDPKRWHGCDLDFTGVVFDGGDFSEATFSGGTVDFSRAKFSGGDVSFLGAKFSGGDVSFSAATFSGGTVDFSHAKFSGGDVSFFGAKFSGGEVSFADARFSGGDVSFSGATFSGSEMYFVEAEFSGGEVSFKDAVFSDGDVGFSRAEFSGGDVSFSGATLSGGEVYFPAAVFSGSYVSFFGAKFSGSKVSLRSVFSGGKVSFSGSEFSGGKVSFGRAKFSGGEVSLSSVFFGSEVSFSGAEFAGGEVSFIGARFAGGEVDLSEPRTWTVPPKFDTWTDGWPSEVLLPLSGTSPAVGPEPDSAT